MTHPKTNLSTAPAETKPNQQKIPRNCGFVNSDIKLSNTNIFKDQLVNLLKGQLTPKFDLFVTHPLILVS